jgi:hypothetical protein
MAKLFRSNADEADKLVRLEGFPRDCLTKPFLSSKLCEKLE